MRVAELMQKDVRTIAPEASVAELVRAMADSRVSGLPVVSPTGHVIGVVSATDVLQASAEPEDSRARTTLFEHTMVRDLMTPDPFVIQPDADVREAAKHMLYGDVRRLFVEDQGRLVGVISQTDIAHAVGTGRI
jgi:CBS domain-containing protein